MLATEPSENIFVAPVKLTIPPRVGTTGPEISVVNCPVIVEMEFMVIVFPAPEVVVPPVPFTFKMFSEAVAVPASVTKSIGTSKGGGLLDEVNIPA